MLKILNNDGAISAFRRLAVEMLPGRRVCCVTAILPCKTNLSLTPPSCKTKSDRPRT